MLPAEPADPPAGRGLTQLLLAGAAVLLAAADTYVVVLALPDVMASVGLDVDELGRAAPIVTVFLLGYVAVLPLVGRISDLAGRLPVLTGCLLLFAAGSLLTASADTLPGVVVGRGVQGVGAGGLVPVALALVADVYPAERRGPALGLVGAAQEVGAVLGPLYGALLLAAGDWRLIFWVNLVAGLVLAAALGLSAGRRAGGRPDPVGLALAGLTAAAAGLQLIAPARLTDHITWGTAFTGLVADHAVTSPLVLAALALAVLTLVRAATAPHGVRPVPSLRGVRVWAAGTDLPGAVLSAVALGAVVLLFSVADPQREVVARSWPLLSAVAVVAALGFVLHERRTGRPLVPLAAFSARAASGGLLVSFFLGAALIGALVDVPVFARVSGRDQLDAALLLVRLLVAVPIGAVAGGVLLGRLGARGVTGVGSVLAAVGLATMVGWEGPGDPTAALGTGALALAGLGFGLTIAPVNAAVLAATARQLHGLAGALVVVARTVGMLVGLSALTAVGLHRFNEVAARVPPPDVSCPSSPADCPLYEAALRDAAITQVQTVFGLAAVCAAVAAVAALGTLGGRVRDAEA